MDFMTNTYENPYILLTPGPLSTSATVKEVMLRDWCTWDGEYNTIVLDIRKRLVAMAGVERGYCAVLMQGSGTFSVESTIISAVPKTGKLLVAANGAYGKRIATIAERAAIPVTCIDFGELSPPYPDQLQKELEQDPAITHLAVVHCETTTGMINPVKEIGLLAEDFGKTYIVDAMSSFGGIPIDMDEIRADFLISSANKCIQGVPGFGFVIAREEELKKLEGRAPSLSLDLYDQWRVMEEQGGKWRFTSPTHVVRAFAQALVEHEKEGGVAARYARYQENHRILVEGMAALGFKPLLDSHLRSPIITAFYNPPATSYDFAVFYKKLKNKGFVIYPGKVTTMDTFRIGNIGDIGPGDMTRLVAAVKDSIYW